MSTDRVLDGWTRLKFGDVVRNVNENSHDLHADGLNRVVGLEHLDPGSLSVVRWDMLADLPDGTTFTRKFKPGHVLFGKRRAYQRKVAVPNFDGVCSGDILVFEPADERMLSKFLPYLVQSDGFFDHALGTSAGSLSPRTKWAELAKYEFALPPLDEQQKIVGVLSLVDEVLRRSATVAHHAEMAVSSFVAKSDSSVRTVKLSSVLTLLTKGTTPTSIGASFSPSGVRFLKAENVIGGRIDYNVESFIDSATDALLSRSRLKAGDVLLTIAGTIGRSAVVDDSELTANCNQAVAILRPSLEVDPWFLSEWLGGIGASRQIEQRMVSNTISNLSLGVIGDLDFPVLTKEAQAAAVSGILAARSVGRVARAHGKRVMQMFDVIRSELLSGGLPDVQ